MIFLILFLNLANADDATLANDATATQPIVKQNKKKIVIIPQNQKIDFEGLNLEGELKAPGEFYFQENTQEKFDDLTKRRPNFRREMMRDAVVAQ